MGTRGTITIVADGKRKTMYNHYDSYTSHLGAQLMEFIADADQETLIAQAHALTAVDTNEDPTPADIEVLASRGITSPEGVSTGKDWYAWLRTTQGDLARTFAVGFFEQHDGSEEFNYTLDFDHLLFTAQGWSGSATFPFDSLPSVEDLQVLIEG